MSRCFPYPPPGYCGNGASYQALIESIKLQKETNKTKTERKREKRANKEKKEKRQKEKNEVDEIKLQKNKNGDSQIKTTNATTEVFEKSDLTEEHGPSIGSQQPSYSSDSTQNSNKRKRDYSSSVPDSSTSYGKPIKIRFLKKHKGSDSGNFVADVRSNIHPSVPSSSNFDRIQFSSVKMNGVPAKPGFTGRENTAQTKSNQIIEGRKIGDPNRLYYGGRIQSAPSSSKPVFRTGPQPPTVQSFGRQVIPQIQLAHEIPSSSASRNIDDQKLLASVHHGVHNHVSNKPSTSDSVERTHIKVTVARNDGPTSLNKQKEDLPKVGLTRTEKKMLKKHSKYEKLVGSWLPPVFEAHLPEVDSGEDWLSGSKASSSLISKAEVETCRQSVAPWQPCARYLAEVDIHALPYTVPF